MGRCSSQQPLVSPAHVVRESEAKLPVYMIPKNHKRECASQLCCRPENAPMGDGPDSETAMKMNKVGPNSAKLVRSNVRKRRVLCSIGILAMSGPCTTLLGALILSPCCVGMASALRSEGREDVVTQDSISEGGKDRGTWNMLAPGRVHGNLKHIKRVSLELESREAHESGEEAATLLNG